MLMMSKVESLPLGGSGINYRICVHVLPFLFACCSWTTVDVMYQELLQHMSGKHCFPAFLRLITIQLTAHSHQCLLCSVLVQKYQWPNKALYRLQARNNSHRMLPKLWTAPASNFDIDQPVHTYTFYLLLQGN